MTTAPLSALACAEGVLSLAVHAVWSAQAPAGVSLPGPIIDQNSLLSLVDQATAQALQEAENCLDQTDPTCSPIVVRNSFLSLIDQTAQQAIQEADNCVSLTDATCAAVVQVVNQQAQSIESAVTSCVGGSNDTCNALLFLTNGEIEAVLGIAEGCVSGQNTVCASALTAVSQTLAEAITCAVGPVGPAAPPNIPPVTVLGSDPTGGGAPPTCEQVKAFAIQDIDAAVTTAQSCVAGTDTVCAQLVATVTGAAQIVSSCAVEAANNAPCSALNDWSKQLLAPVPGSPVGGVSPVGTDEDPGTVFPANELRGTIVLGSGLGAGGVTVSFYIDPGQDPNTTPDLLGTTTTDAGGNYLATITPDAYATSLANDNGGVLNVLISATVDVALPGVTAAPPILEIADGVTPLTLGGSAQYWLSQPPTLLLTPAGQTDLSSTPAPDLTGPDPTAPGVDPAINYEPAADTSTVPTLNGVPTGDDPFIINGVDYQQAGLTNQGPCQPPAHQPMYESATVLSQKARNIVAGETHAWWDAHALWDYGASTADSTIQNGFSTDDVNRPGVSGDSAC